AGGGLLKHSAAIGFVALLLTLVAEPAIADDDSPEQFFNQKGSQQKFEIRKNKTTPGKPGGGDRARGGGSAGGKGSNQGRTPSQDTVDSVCEGDMSHIGGCGYKEYVAVGDPSPAPSIDPQEEALKAADKLDLPTPDIHTAPEDPTKTLVGLETWLWIDEGDWGSLSESVEVDGTTLTVTAKPSQVRWDMGEDTKTCAGPGRAWRDGMDADATTSCSYAYRHTSTNEPGGAYDLSVVVRYRLTWECSGDCDEDSGDLGQMDTEPATGSLQVAERQTVVR